jgi:predicted nucleotidyltransferase
MGTPRIDIPHEQIAEFCRKHRIRRLAFFGSVLRDDFRPDSDVDVLVEFEPGATPGLKFFHMEGELAGLLGRKVDFNTPPMLNKYYRERVLREAFVAYDAA